MRHLFVIAAAVTSLNGCTVPQSTREAATYSNPVLDPDPVALEAPDGFYHAYA